MGSWDCRAEAPGAAHGYRASPRGGARRYGLGMARTPTHPPRPEEHPVLLTKRLRLRRLQMDDVDAMHKCYGDAEAMRYWNRPAHARRDETDRAVRRAMVFAPWKRMVWAVARDPGDRCIGMVNYHNADMDNRRAEIGYIIQPSQQGKGFALEAVSAVISFCFAEMGMHRLQAVVDPDNVASRALLGKLGFREEGVLRESLLMDGVWRDDVIHGLLVGEWKGK